MRRLLLLAPLLPALGGCPPPSQYLIADVTIARGQGSRTPVADALVAADCGREYGDAALRTNSSGRARLQFRDKVDASKCSVTVAKPGYPTVEATGVSICTTPACPATHVELDARVAYEPPPSIHEPLPLVVPPEYELDVQPREYAREPRVRRDMEVAE